jgi:hypothetical protein
MLQRHPLGALRDELVEAFEELRGGFGEGQPTTVRARRVGGEQFGVGARRPDPRLGERHRGGLDHRA